MAVPAASGAQSVALPDSAWASAVDAYLAGDEARAAATLLNVPYLDVANQSRIALDAWLARATAGGPGAAAERRLVLRRVQVAAVLPLEILSSLSTRLRVDRHMKAYEDAALDALKRLDDAERLHMVPLGAPQGRTRELELAGLRRFRTWWRIAFLQYLMNAGRHGDFARHARQVTLEPDDAVMGAEFHFLQGMVAEMSARAPGVAARGSALSTVPPSSRAVNLAREEATRAYQRALEAMPSHVEATLHLGRVLLDRQRPEDTIRTLDPLATSACATTHCAVAWLFIGEAHEMRGQTAEASKAYARASGRIDVRQSALMALMQLAARRGEASATALVGHFREDGPLARQDAPDAWSVYVSGRRQYIEAVLGPLREAMLK